MPRVEDPQPDPANLSQAELASNQEAKVVPWFCGHRKIAVTWVAPIYNLKTLKVQGPPSTLENIAQWDPGMFPAFNAAPGLGGGILGGKGAGRQTVTMSFGSLVGVVSAGPVDELVAILMNGGTIWPTSANWADSIIDFPVATYRRTGGASARLRFENPHGLHNGNKIIVSNMDVASFDLAVATAVNSVGSTTLSYASAGANVAETAETSGLMTKIVHYTAGDLVRDGSRVWKCILTHDGMPATRPPNAMYWVENSVLRAASANPYPFSAIGFGPNGPGLGYFYWGTATQTLDAVGEQVLLLNGHPPYRHQAVLVLKDWILGSSSKTAPNIEVIVRRAPAQAIIVGGSAALDDAQANPLAVQAELLTDPIFGVGRPAAMADAASWQARADELATAPDRSYLSPLIDTALTFREFTAQMLAYFDGWLRFDGAGAIEAGRFLHDEAPPAFTSATTIDYHDLIGEIEWDADGWPGTYNECVVKFQDRDRAFKDASMKAVNSLNRDIVGEARGASLDRPWITRDIQASEYATEWLKLNAQPKISGSLTVRSEKAASIEAGTIFLLTHDALAFSVVCRCIEKKRTQPPSGRVTLRFENERGIAPVPYRATPAAVGGTTLPRSGAVDLFQFVQPPPAISGGGDFRMGLLAARTSELSHGVKVWLRQADGASFMLLGSKTMFEVNGSLVQDYGVPVGGIIGGRSRAANVADILTLATGLNPGAHFAVDDVSDATYDIADAVVIAIPAPTNLTYANVGANDGLHVGNDGIVTPLPDDDSETLQVNFHENSLQADIDRISESQTDDAINDNTILVWLFKASDPTVFEIATLKAIRLDGGVYKLKVRRARFSTTMTAFTAADCSVWIGYRTDLVAYANNAFEQFAEDATAATLRLQSFTTYEESDLTDPDVCPDIAFTFADPYSPVLNWTEFDKNGVVLPGFAGVGTFLPTDVFTFFMQITDANGDLTEAKVVARLGTLEQTLWSQSFDPSAQQLKSMSFSLPVEGTWRIFGIVKDGSGTVREYETLSAGLPVQWRIKPAGSTMVATPLVTPGGGKYSGSSKSVSLSCDTAGATIKYQIRAYGAAVGAWTTYTGAFHVQLESSGRTLYAYALKAGLTDSAVVRNDYWED